MHSPVVEWSFSILFLTVWHMTLIEAILPLMRTSKGYYVVRELDVQYKGKETMCKRRAGVSDFFYRLSYMCLILEKVTHESLNTKLLQ